MVADRRLFFFSHLPSVVSRALSISLTTNELRGVGVLAADEVDSWHFGCNEKGEDSRGNPEDTKGGKKMLITMLTALTGAYTAWLTKTWWTKTWW